MAYINVDEIFILDNTGLQVDQTTDLPFKDAGLTESQQAQARKNIGAGGTNPNLIDNPWFTVRQRGNGPFSANGFTVDRWQIGGGPPTVTPQSPYGVSISASIGYNLLQNLPYTVAEYGGKTMTLSAIVDGELVSKTFVYGTGVLAYVTFNNNNDLVRYDCNNAQVRFTHNVASATHNYTVTAVKLELGTVSTLANDTPPDYYKELDKCQWYFERIKPIQGNYANFGYGYSSTTTRGIIFAPMQPKRDYSYTVTTSGSFRLSDSNRNYTAVTIAKENGVCANNSLVLYVDITTAGTLMTAGTPIMFGAANSNTCYIDVSSDL